jgi:hypothetical protein
LLPWPGTSREDRAAKANPDAVAVDGDSLVFADQNTSRIRQVTG